MFKKILLSVLAIAAVLVIGLLIAAAMLLVPMLIGIFIGNRFHHGMSELTFRRTVSGALIASGLALLIK